MNRRFSAIIIVAVTVVIVGAFILVRAQSAGAPIKVGVLHSLTGTMGSSEQPVVDATLLAIREINERGGVLGRQIEPIVVDGQSDWPTFAREAERLITQEEVNVIFGCWTSACRKTVKPVFEQYNHLLIYPVQYEGLEASPNIIYTGAAPNQQIIPAVAWSLENLGQRLFLVGSDYVFPRTANAIIRDQAAAAGAQIVGEEYLLLGSTDVDAIVRQIVRTQPDVILNTINGDSNVAFFSALRQAGITPEKIPTVSFSIAEPELQNMDVQATVGDYAAWNYFQSVAGAENTDFVERFRAAYGADRVVSDPLEAAYFGVHLWALGVADAGSPNVSAVHEAMLDQSLNAPEGVVHIDFETQHTWKTVRIGRIREDGQFDIVWDSVNPIRPKPYPVYRTQQEWETFLADLSAGWGGQWANPG